MSFLRRIYYDLKPFVPERMRLALRRKLAARLRADCRIDWPIKEIAASAPENWPGWPGAKRFAFVLTHDVEGRRGLSQVPKLAELEAGMGFRSSFNFIPEGCYSVPPSLRAELVANGFEVGVHDLRHDGKLYRSRSDFSEQAERINSYLGKWGATGFRSAFMHHNLEWLHDLHVDYDMSTFDTDPFEPQPDGVDTIFPFWIPSAGSRNGNGASAFASRAGYMELPYTLPQDSTLYLILNERTIDIWKKKLDWIAAHGGMALLNVHPDYINFEDQWRMGQYPVALYRELLQYVSDNYESAVWHTLPAEVSRELKPSLSNSSPLSSVVAC